MSWMDQNIIFRPVMQARWLPAPIVARVTRFLGLGWSVSEVHDETGVSERTIRRWIGNLEVYASVRPPARRARGPPLKMTLADWNALREALFIDGWMMQDKMVY
jgi:hypothetical protein